MSNRTSQPPLLVPRKSEIMSPEEYLNLPDNQQKMIASAQVVPPQLGGKGFGGIKIVWRFPIFRRMARR